MYNVNTKHFVIVSRGAANRNIHIAEAGLVSEFLDYFS